MPVEAVVISVRIDLAQLTLIQMKALRPGGIRHACLCQLAAGADFGRIGGNC